MEFQWRGRSCTQTDEKVLAKTYKKIVKSDQWNEVAPSMEDTNANAIVMHWGTNKVVLVPEDWTNIVSTNGYVLLSATNYLYTATNGIDVIQTLTNKLYPSTK